jgi:hypothetical protein
LLRFFLLIAIFASFPQSSFAEPVTTPSSIAPVPNDTVYAMTTVEDEIVFIGGEFTQLNGQSADHLAAFTTDGQVIPWNPGVNGPVYTIAVTSDRIYIGGSFSQVAGKARTNAAAFDTDGNLVSWNPTPNAAVNAISVDDNGTVYLGGDFTNLGATPRNHIAAVSAAGSVTSWNPNVDGPVITVSAAGDIVYIGGDFAQVGGQTRNNVAAISLAGSLSSWNPNANDVVGILLPFNNVIYIGGDFTQVGGQTRNFLAAIDAAGSVTAWNPNPNQSVLALSANGSTVYIGGFFTQVGSSSRTYVAGVSTAGELTSWNPVLNTPPVTSIGAMPTALFIGGDFTQVNSQSSSPYLAGFANSGGATYPTPYTTPYTTPYPTPYPTPGGVKDPSLDQIIDQLQLGDLLTFNDAFPIYLVGQDGLYPFSDPNNAAIYLQQTGKQVFNVVDNPALYSEVIFSTPAESILGSIVQNGGGGPVNIPTPPVNPTQPKKVYATGSLVNDGGTVYLIMGFKKIAFTSFHAFNGLGYSLKNVVNGSLVGYELAPTYWIDSPYLAHPWGSWVKYNGTIYYVHESGLIGVPTMKIFLANGGKEKNILPINDADIASLSANHNQSVMVMNDGRIYK